jgi:hypothetical protein
VRGRRRACSRLTLLALLACGPVADPGPAAARPIQSHSMIHLCCTPDAEQARLIAAARASGARIVRFDVEVHGIVQASPTGWTHDYSRLDEAIARARRHHIRILGILSGTPSGMTACPPGVSPEASWKCAAADPVEYARQVVAIMEHAGAGVFAWEFWNEPDHAYMYLGTPEAYGRMLGAVHRRARGRFRITSGGVADLGTGLPFLARAQDAGARFDVGNVHLRGEHLRARAERASRFFGDRPLWVTEHGYPSHPSPEAQVRYLTRSIPALRRGGADQIFVTLRDIDEFGPRSPFASEGILGKPAWGLIVGLNRGVRSATRRTPARRPRACRASARRCRGRSSGTGATAPSSPAAGTCRSRAARSPT